MQEYSVYSDSCLRWSGRAVDEYDAVSLAAVANDEYWVVSFKPSFRKEKHDEIYLHTIAQVHDVPGDDGKPKKAFLLIAH